MYCLEQNCCVLKNSDLVIFFKIGLTSDFCFVVSKFGCKLIKIAKCNFKIKSGRFMIES